MKRRDFVKIAALLPVSPALVAASQLKPAESLGKQPENACAYADTPAGNMLCSHTPRHGAYWVTFDNVKKQTKFGQHHMRRYWRILRKGC